MQMDTGMDTGAMLEKVSVPIGPEMTQGELHDELKEKGAALLLQTIDDLSAGTVTAEPQEETKATYASLITRDMNILTGRFLQIPFTIRFVPLTPGRARIRFCRTAND